MTTTNNNLPGHTPGPWRVDTDIPGLIEINDKGGASIVYSEPMFRMGNHAENLANARLIAAAPELLLALMNMVDEYGARYGMSDTLMDAENQNHVIKPAMEIIAKATGKEGV